VQDGVDVYSWVAKRRADYKRGKLSPEQVEALNRLGFRWTPAADDEQRLPNMAVAFHRRHGHLRVPDSDPALYPLYQWIIRQRLAYHNGTLDPQRAADLTAMGMQWQRPRKLSFDDYCALARRFRTEHDHLDVPHGCRVDGINLYQWVLKQRHLANKNQLPDDQRRRLDELGMVWSFHDAAWQKSYKAAAAYLAREGHLTPPEHHQENGVKLSNWLVHQRRLDRAHQLHDDRRQQLVALGVVAPICPGQAQTPSTLPSLEVPSRQHGPRNSSPLPADVRGYLST
jgi:hypothetical protein